MPTLTIVKNDKFYRYSNLVRLKSKLKAQAATRLALCDIYT